MILPVIEIRAELEIPNNVGPLVAAVFTLLSLVWFSVLLRLGTRGFIARCLGWDDATICLTMVCGLFVLHHLLLTLNLDIFHRVHCGDIRRCQAHNVTK